MDTVDSVEEAQYPREELIKYSIVPDKNVPVGSLNDEFKPKSNDISYNVPDEVNDVAESPDKVVDDGIIRVKVRKSKKKKIQTSNKPSVLIKRRINERSWTLRNWYAHIHWKNFSIVILVPLIGLIVYFSYKPVLVENTFYFLVLNYTITVLSINMLYHKYWSHHSINLKSESFVRFLTIICSGAGITNAKNWCSSHRAHHRFTDVTDSDPHNIRKGLFFSHYGWMILIHNNKVLNTIEQSKLDVLPNQDIIEWQLKYYFTLYIISGLLIPAIICGYFWGDYLGGLVFGGFLKIFLVQQSIFSINSLGHTIGSRSYNNAKSPRNNFLINLITFGEGNQNFHHEFPSDYRNGYKWYHNFNLTKLSINLLKIVGLVDNVKTTNQSIIDKSIIQQQQQILDDKRSKLNWGIPIDKLPVFSPKEFKRLAMNSKDRYLVVVSGIIHDVTPFAKDHPGGIALIKSSHGKDATAAFSGAVYQHSNAARNLLATMRIGKLGGSEELYWKQQRIENKNVPIDNDTEGKRIVRSQETSLGKFGSTANAA